MGIALVGLDYIVPAGFKDQMNTTKHSSRLNLEAAMPSTSYPDVEKRSRAFGRCNAVFKVQTILSSTKNTWHRERRWSTQPIAFRMGSFSSYQDTLCTRRCLEDVNTL